MSKYTATAGEIIAALSTVPANTPIFVYSEYEECETGIEMFDTNSNFIIYKDDEGKELYIPPHHCKGDSIVKMHWEENGEGLVGYLREKSWNEREEGNKIFFV